MVFSWPITAKQFGLYYVMFRNIFFLYWIVISGSVTHSLASFSFQQALGSWDESSGFRRHSNVPFPGRALREHFSQRSGTEPWVAAGKDQGLWPGYKRARLQNFKSIANKNSKVSWNFATHFRARLEPNLQFQWSTLNLLFIVSNSVNNNKIAFMRSLKNELRKHHLEKKSDHSWKKPRLRVLRCRRWYRIDHSAGNFPQGRLLRHYKLYVPRIQTT